MMLEGSGHLDLPPPAILKPKALWTGKQLFSILIRPNKSSPVKVNLDAAGRALSREKEIAFAGAITGASNLAASIVCRDTEHLYRFVTDRVGAIEGVQTMEVLPVLRHVKQAGALLDGDRLAVQ